MLINFWARHGYIEDAMSFIITNKLPQTIFVEELFQHCLAHSKLLQLKRAILKIGMYPLYRFSYLLRGGGGKKDWC